MLVSHFAAASKPSVLPRLHSSTNASTLSRATFRRSQQQRRGFRSIVKTSYYHRVTNTTSRDTDILNRRLMLSRQAGIPISFRVAGISGTVVCERKAIAEVDLQKLKHDSNQAAVYITRSQTFTSYKPISSEPRTTQSYIAERNASRRIPGFNPKKTKKSSDTEHAFSVKTFSGYYPQFEEFKPPVAPVSTGNLLFNKLPGTPAPSGATTYVTDSELYLDGRTLEQELNPYYKPVQAFEPDGLPVDAVCPIQEALSEYDAKPNVEYSGFGYNEPDGKPIELPCSVEEGLNDYDQTAKYDGARPFTFNEPDGLPVEPACEVESALDQYDQKATYGGAKPFTFNEPDGLPIEAVSEVASALNEYDLKKEANGYQPFGHNEPNGQPPQKVDSTRAALSEYDQKWELKIENDNFDEDSQKDLGEVARTAPIVAAKTDRASAIKDEAVLIGAVPIRKVASGSIKGRKETPEERTARRAKLESDLEKSSTQFVKDIEAFRKTDKVRHSLKQLKEFEIEASVLLNQYHHLRFKIDARLEELAEEDRKAGFVNGKKPVSTGGTALNDTIQSAAITHPSKSGIDVRREEAVFSGPKGERTWKRKQRRGGKVKSVLGGAAAGAGVFYAAGVVSELFTTGGSEWTGVVGL